MLRRLALLLAAACLLAGCGEEAAGEGAAELWITRDRGSEVVLSTSVPAGISALEALRRKTDVETRYGGRFVQAIDGIEGDIAGQHDWFYFVNGYEADISAADYELHDGDVLWWDHRSWEGEMRQPVVVGAFPEPFLHGWDGKKRPGGRAAGRPVSFRRGSRSWSAASSTRLGRGGERARARARVGVPCPARRLPGGSRRVRARAARRRAAARRPVAGALPVRGPAVSPVPAAALLAALAAAALLADRTISVAIIAAGLFALCLRAPRGRRWPYLVGTLASGLVLFLFSPLVARYGGVVYWEGPEVPVIGQLDVTSEEVSEALFQSLRLIAVGLAFAAYALLLDLDGLLLAGGRLRRSVLAVALATRLVPTLERDAAGFVEALRGRGLVVEGVRGRARLISPARCRLTRAVAQPRRVDGSARVRTAGPDPGAVRRRGPPSTAWRSWLPLWSS